jgi:hypothetical protein
MPGDNLWRPARFVGKFLDLERRNELGIGWVARGFPTKINSKQSPIHESEQATTDGCLSFPACPGE